MIDILITLFAVIFSLVVVFSNRTVVSAFSLLLALLCIGGAYFQLGANFLSAVQVLVNAGAIAILFVFVMMLINLEHPVLNKDKNKFKLILGAFAILVSLGVLAIVINTNLESFSKDFLLDNSMKTLFGKLFEVYYLPFELATMLLLGAIVSVVVLTKQDKEPLE